MDVFLDREGEYAGQLSGYLHNHRCKASTA